jgi:hypothetical protein
MSLQRNGRSLVEAGAKHPLGVPCIVRGNTDTMQQVPEAVVNAQ